MHYWVADAGTVRHVCKWAMGVNQPRPHTVAPTARSVIRLGSAVTHGGPARSKDDRVWICLRPGLSYEPSGMSTSQVQEAHSRDSPLRWLDNPEPPQRAYPEEGEIA